MFRALGICIVAAGVLAAASASDYHTTKDPSHQFYASSAFAHGHRHGYEEGFHAGDEDYQLRRLPSLSPKMPRSKGYRSEFGDKKTYLLGFETGFRAGYADSYSGHTFRSEKGLSDLVTPPSSVESSEKPLKEEAKANDFDLGVAEGYRAGFSNDANIANEPGVAESAAWHCQQEHHAASFCNGYGSGYVLGRADSTSIARLQKSQTQSLVKNIH